MKYKIYAQLSFDIEAEDENKAKELASEKLKEIEGRDLKVENAKVADEKSGYFLN